MESHRRNGFFPAIINTIRRSADTMAEGADALKGLVTDSKAIGEIPIVSVAVKILNIKDIFIQQRLEKNSKAFLAAVSHADTSKIEELKSRLEKDPDCLDDFADTVMSILIEGEKPLKSQLLGRLIISLSNERLSLNEFETLSQIIHVAATPALKALHTFMARTGGKPYDNRAGQVPEEPLLLSIGVAYRFGTGFRVSELGEKLYVYGFGGAVAT